MNQITQAAQAAGPEEVLVMLTLHFKPGSSEKVLAKIIPSIRLTRAEPGNEEFQLFEVKGSEDKFVIFERWKDQAALEWHWQQPYTKETLELFEEHLAKPLSDARDVLYLTDVIKQGA